MRFKDNSLLIIIIIWGIASLATTLSTLIWLSLKLDIKTKIICELLIFIIGLSISLLIGLILLKK
jgi:nucleoside recognition membrane protein YjiH